MRRWALLLGGLVVWAAHFFTVYAIGEVMGATIPARIAVVALTVVACAANLLLARAALRMRDETAFERWRRSVILLGAGLSGIAVVWQALPSLI